MELRQAKGFGNLFEIAGTVVLVRSQETGGTCPSSLKTDGLRGPEEIWVEVIVPVDPGHAGAHRLRKTFAIGPIDLFKRDSYSFSHLGKHCREGRFYPVSLRVQREVSARVLEITLMVFLVQQILVPRITYTVKVKETRTAKRATSRQYLFLTLHSCRTSRPQTKTKFQATRRN